MDGVSKPGALFGLHMFYYACAELLINDLAVGAVGAGNVVALYGVISVAVAAGFLLFPLLRRVLKESASQRLSLIAAWLLNLAAFATVLTASTPALFSVAAVLVTLTAGYIGGFVFFSISVGPTDKAYFGRLFGFAGAAAFCVQYVFTKLIAALGESGFAVLSLTLGLAVSACAALLLFAYGPLPFQAIRADNAVPASPQGNVNKYLWGVFLIIAVIWAMEGVLDGVVTGLHAEQTLNVSEFPRLFHAVGLVLAGFLFDCKEGRLYAPAVMLLMIAQVIAVFIFTSAEGFNVALGAIYFCGAFGSVYASAALTQAAESSPSPALWAVMGRVAKYTPNGIMSVVGGYFYTTNTHVVFTLLYIVLLGALFTLFLTQDKLAVRRAASVYDDAPPPDMSTIEELTAAYDITHREAEVLRLLIEGRSTAEIAEAMSITDKSVRNYISSLMSKTKSNTRGKMIAKLTRNIS
jgi:DNA-binding CsgD family transcriptional regulator